MLYKYWDRCARASAMLVVKPHSCQNNKECSLQRQCNLWGLQFMEYKTHSCQNTMSTAVLQFRNTRFDKLACDRLEHIRCIIRPALLKTCYQRRLIWLTLLMWPAKFGEKFISGMRRQWPRRLRCWQFLSRRDVETDTTTLSSSTTHALLFLAQHLIVLRLSCYKYRSKYLLCRQQQ